MSLKMEPWDFENGGSESVIPDQNGFELIKLGSGDKIPRKKPMFFSFLGEVSSETNSKHGCL